MAAAGLGRLERGRPQRAFALGPFERRFVWDDGTETRLSLRGTRGEVEELRYGPEDICPLPALLARGSYQLVTADGRLTSKQPLRWFVEHLDGAANVGSVEVGGELGPAHFDAPRLETGSTLRLRVHLKQGGGVVAWIDELWSVDADTDRICERGHSDETPEGCRDVASEGDPA